MAEYDSDSAGSNAEEAKVRGQYGDLTLKLKGWYKEDIKKVSEWRKQAREDYEFYSGEQWSQEDMNVLRDQRRPAMVFNRVAPLVNAVVGSEINNRREVQYIPREVGDAQANEVLTSAGEWFRDQTGAEDEESDAFEDAVICGMGWTDTRLDFEEDPDGAPKVTRLDPLRMAWDCTAVKPNLEDAQRLWYVDEKPYSEIKEMFPGVAPELLHAGWAKILGNDPTEPHDQDEADKYTGTQNEYADGGYSKKMCTLVECRWFEKVPYFRGPSLDQMGMPTGEPREYNEQQIKLIRTKLPDFPAVRQYKKVVKRAFIGAEVLAEPDQPLVPPGMFGWECVTGYRDKMKGLFYGVVRTTKDPQRWSNKFFSQVMFLLNSQSKGGLLVERGAFDDDRQAEESWAKTEAFTYLKNGALSGANPRVKEKPTAQFPAGFFTLFQESKEAISQVTGLSPEFVGTREVDQAGVLEYQRRQSSLNLLASLFNSLRRYRKRQGKVMLYLIQNYLSDGRLVRILGDDKAQYVPLTKDSVSNVQYDIIVDDAPTSPNEKEKVWGILQTMLPMLKDLMTPEILMEVLPYTPLPASFVDKLKKKAQEAAAQPKPPSPEEQKMAMEQQKAEMEMVGKQADLQMKQAENQMDIEMKGIDLMIKQQEAQLDAAIATQKAQADMSRIAMQERQNAIKQQNANSRRASAAD
ncbi:phage portal protein [Sinorhizobium meliloti]|uniref:portal protein n=1 Tax=Rhizobium meliloti TaxID=382 RepID=UPI000B5AB134|nr:portal protein [Sinorhizobium meliloti]ASJ58985.1 phage portal protein [Sinorhizobium meliloti]MCK3783487.1 phage portal protein [Sinorhizobium meliloti]MCK3787883.1 phage portal protein [Sinorhizobium meliloti]MCK3794840.1 phage portal protein [Sinorhizobium meliloti]